MFANYVEDLMTQRKANQKKSDELAMSLAGLNSPNAVLAALNGRPVDSFPTSISAAQNGPEALAKAKQGNPLTLPNLTPPSGSEIPDANGPGPLSTGSGYSTSSGQTSGASGTSTSAGQVPYEFPGITSSDLTSLGELGKTIQNTASQSNQDMKNTLDNYHNGNYQEGNKSSEASHKASFEVLTSLGSMLGRAETLIANSPGTDAAKAVQDLVSSSGVSSIQLISQQMSTYGNEVVNPNSQGSVINNFTSAQMEEVIAGSKCGVSVLSAQLTSMKAIAVDLAPLIQDPEIRASLDAALATAQATYDKAKEELDKALLALEEKKKAEAAAAAGTSTDTSTGTSTDTSTGDGA